MYALGIMYTTTALEPVQNRGFGIPLKGDSEG